jgi:hypothetical protein
MHAFFRLAIVKRKNHRSVLLAASLVAALALAGAVRAETEKLPDTFGLRLGGYSVSNADTIARLDANSGPVGVYVDFADTLGGNRTATVVRLDGLYRFNERHGLGFGWYDLKFTGSRVLDQNVEWGGVTYPLSTQVDSELKFDVYKLNYQYSLFHNDEAELGASVGLHVMRISAGISASGISQSQSQSATAPLPVWGLFASYKFTPRFSAYYNYQFFNINVQDKFSGGLQDFLLGTEYRLFRNFALGVAYNRFALNLKSKGDATTLYLESSWNGGMLYGAVYF